MKKILIITLEHPPQIGGIASYVHQFANALPDKKKVIVYAPKMKGGPNFDKAQGYKTIRKIPYFPIFIWPRWVKMFFQIKKIIKEEKIDILFIHHVLPVGYIGWLIKKFKKIPYIIFSHGTDVLTGTATTWKRKMVKKVTSQAELIVFNSESLKHRLVRVLPELEPKSIIVYPCPDSNFYNPPPAKTIKELKKLYALEGKKVILSIGRLDEGKGFTHMVRIMPKILKKAPNLVWLIIGDGPKKNNLLKQIQKLNLQNIVRFVGEVPHAKIKEFYYLADLFVLLTHPDEGRKEGLGLVFLEAAATGLPVVAGKSGGVSEAVIHTQTGLVVDIYQGDPGVIDAINQLLFNKDYAVRLADQAKARMKSQFQWEHQLARLGKWINQA